MTVSSFLLKIMWPNLSWKGWDMYLIRSHSGCCLFRLSQIIWHCLALGLVAQWGTKFGICDQALGWIASYSNGRKQFTVFNRYNSDFMPLSVGVAQGSVLDPTLFFVVVNAIHVISFPLLIRWRRYIYSIEKTADEAVAQLDKALDKLHLWCILHRLTPQWQKSEAMLICKTRAIGPVAPILIGTDAIE